MKNTIAPPVGDANGGNSRRGFLKFLGAAVIAVVGAASLSTPIRRARATVPVWTTVPDQTWVVGVPVYLDLATFCTDADGDPLAFSLSSVLPPGVTLSGSVISGTPTAPFSAKQFVATADDRAGGSPSTESSLVASPNPSRGAVRLLGVRRSISNLEGTLRIFGASGRRVYEKRFEVSGSHYEIDWDGIGADGAKLPSGVYVATVHIGSETATARLVLAE